MKFQKVNLIWLPDLIVSGSGAIELITGQQPSFDKRHCQFLFPWSKNSRKLNKNRFNSVKLALSCEIPAKPSAKAGGGRDRVPFSERGSTCNDDGLEPKRECAEDCRFFCFGLFGGALPPRLAVDRSVPQKVGEVLQSRMTKQTDRLYVMPIRCCSVSNRWRYSVLAEPSTLSVSAILSKLWFLKNEVIIFKSQWVAFLASYVGGA